jgi:hypothetical protein
MPHAQREQHTPHSSYPARRIFFSLLPPLLFSFFYDYYGWREGSLFGKYDDGKIIGFFKAETSVDTWPEFGSAMIVPVNGKFVMVKDNATK